MANAQYRRILTADADNIIKYNQQAACKQCCNCPSVYAPIHKIEYGPPKYFSSCRTGSLHHDGDLKAEYLSKHVENAYSRNLVFKLS